MSATLLAALAKAVRELPDEKLVEVAAPWIAETFASALGKKTFSDLPGKSAGVLPPKPARRAPKRRGGAPVAKAKASRASRAGATENAERVFKAIIGCDGAISRPQIVAKTKLEYHQVGHALKRLKEEGRAFLAGHAKSSRWAITQEAADEAVGG